MERRFLSMITLFATCVLLIGIREQSVANEDYGYFSDEDYGYSLNDEYFFSNEDYDNGNDRGGWVARLEAAGAAGQFIGQKHDYLELGLFAGTPPTDEWFFFTDIRGYWLKKNRHAASAGVGARMLDCSSRIWGANIYYDYMEAKHKSFNQIGIGLESLGACLDFRINGYIPVETHGKSSFRRHNYPGGFVWKGQEKEYSYKGVDVEVGYSLWRNCDFSFYGAAGPYYYYTKGPHHNIIGGQIRLEARFMNYLTLETRFSDDNRYNAQFQGKNNFINTAR